MIAVVGEWYMQIAQPVRLCCVEADDQCVGLAVTPTDPALFRFSPADFAELYMPDPTVTYNATERAAMLAEMHAASKIFYAMACRIGCHPFIEFTGLMNEYLKVCERAHAQGIDFNQCSAHSGQELPMELYEAEYLGEKLGCIFGPSFSDPNLFKALVSKMLSET